MSGQVAIVGGGVVGLAAAIAFASQGREVILLESADLYPREPAALDVRSLALSHATAQILAALDLWQGLSANTAPIKHIHVSSAGFFGVTRLRAADMGVEAMGYVVEYHVLLHQLLDKAGRQSNIRIISPARCLDLRQLDGEVELRYLDNDAEQVMRASLLVVADGAQSSMRDLLGLTATVEEFDQQAVVANLELGAESDAVAFERFTAEGPLALLPLPDRRYALVWTNSPHRAQELTRLSNESFIAALIGSFGHRLGIFTRVGKRACFDLKLTRASALTAGRAVLIGNAANTLHPVAGQGFNLAMRDIAALYDVLQDQELESKRLASALQGYASERKSDQDRTVGLSSSLVRLFSNNLPLLNHARAGALFGLDLCPILKQEFSWQGMGYGLGAYSLMRGQR